MTISEEVISQVSHCVVAPPSNGLLTQRTPHADQTLIIAAPVKSQASHVFGDFCLADENCVKRAVYVSMATNVTVAAITKEV